MTAAELAAAHYRDRIASMWHAGMSAALRGDADALMATQAARLLLRRAISAETARREQHA